MRYDERLPTRPVSTTGNRTELDATARGHRDLAGALIVYRLAGALAELVVGTLVDQRRSLALRPAGLSLRFGDAARLDEVSVSAATVAMLADDPDVAAPGAMALGTTDELVADALDGLVAVYRPLCDAVRARAPFGRSGVGHLAPPGEVAVRRAPERRRDVRPPGRCRHAVTACRARATLRPPSTQAWPDPRHQTIVDKAPAAWCTSGGDGIDGGPRRSSPQPRAPRPRRDSRTVPPLRATRPSCSAPD